MNDLSDILIRHSFRKLCCASSLVMRGRNLKEVQELLGHREFKMSLLVRPP
jgi:site-specific recombinase XerD